MKTLLKILLISSVLVACKGVGKDGAANDSDSSNTNTTLPPDSVLNNRDGSANSAEPEDPAKETIRQIMANLLSSNQEITLLQSEVTDSITKSGVNSERKSLFYKTLGQLEASSKLINRQIEQIVITDLQSSRGKLNEIVSKMKVSERELGGMIARLDKITNYMQVATSLMQTLIPVPAAKPHSKGKDE